MCVVCTFNLNSAVPAHTRLYADFNDLKKKGITENISFKF